jgi:hypothetical protein
MFETFKEKKIGSGDVVDQSNVDYNVRRLISVEFEVHRFFYIEI